MAASQATLAKAVSPRTSWTLSAATGSSGVPEFQKLLHFICRPVYEHHVAATKASVAAAIEDALVNYKGWETFHHKV